MSTYYVLVNDEPKAVDMAGYVAYLRQHPGDEWRRVAATVWGGIRVSTVFLMIDHRYGPGAPLLYETMIFGGVHSEQCWRYTDKGAALDGHALAVEFARANDPNEAPPDIPESSAPTSPAPPPKQP